LRSSCGLFQTAATLKTSFAIRLSSHQKFSLQGISVVVVPMVTLSVTAHNMTQQDSAPSNLRFLGWQREYEASIHEDEPGKLLERIYVAEAAMFNRLQELARTPATRSRRPKARPLRMR
jgi:hypothetical protein